MKHLLLVLSLLVLAGMACAQTQPGLSLEDITAISEQDSFISVGPLPEKPVLMAAEPQAGTDAEADEEQPSTVTLKPKVNFGLMVGAYMPTNSDVRDLFGDTWLRVGIRPIPREYADKYRLTFDFSYYSMEEANGVYIDRVRLIPVTVGILRGFGSGKNVRSYVAVNAGPYYGSFKAPSVGISEKKWKLNANVTGGLVFNDKLSIEGRYEFMEKLAGYDFSAFTVSANYRVFSARL